MLEKQGINIGKPNNSDGINQDEPKPSVASRFENIKAFFLLLWLYYIFFTAGCLWYKEMIFMVNEMETYKIQITAGLAGLLFLTCFTMIKKEHIISRIWFKVLAIVSVLSFLFIVLALVFHDFLDKNKSFAENNIIINIFLGIGIISVISLIPLIPILISVIMKVGLPEMLIFLIRKFKPDMKKNDKQKNKDSTNILR